MKFGLLALVMLGGALGAGMRYAVGERLLERLQDGWPWGTLVVNLAGAFLVGLLFAWFEGRGQAAAAWRAFLIVGVLGGMTTFSALMLECLLYARADRPGWVMGYLAGSVVGGLALVWFGAWLGRAWQG